MLSLSGLTNPNPQVRFASVHQNEQPWARVRVEVSMYLESLSWWVVGWFRSCVFAIIYFRTR